MRHAVLWRGIDMPGHEHCSVYQEAGRWFVSGAAVFRSDREPCYFGLVTSYPELWEAETQA